MLSSMTRSSQKSGPTHRRQNSTPSTPVNGLPNPPKITRSHRRGNSLQENMGQGFQATDRKPQMTTNLGPIPQEHEVSITNPGQHPEFGLHGQDSQVTQPTLAQPGESLPQTATQEIKHHDNQHVPQPSHDQLRELEQHIKSVYGQYANVYVNVIPSPVPAPQKLARSSSSNGVDAAPMPSSFGDLPELHLGPPGSSQETTFTFENPENDIGCDSSYYSSDAYSPGRSPTSSPEQRSFDRFLEDLGQVNQFSLDVHTGTLEPMPYDDELDALLSPARQSSPSSAPKATDSAIAGTLKDTGISAEEVQQYISEQSPTNKRWTCLYPGCDKTFGRRENIRSHVQTHLGDRQFRCPDCGKCFVRQHDLKRHLKIHSGNKPYRCPCGNGFARQDALTRHRQRGNCSGGLPNPNKQPGQRGRPRKRGPAMEKRVEKANRARRAEAAREELALEASLSPSPSFDSFPSSQFVELPDVETTQNDGGTSDPFSFDTASSPFFESSPAASSPFDSQPHAQDLLCFSNDSLAQTPPSSPEATISTAALLHAECAKMSSSSGMIVDPGLDGPEETIHTPKPQRKSVLTTPPTSPLEVPEHLRFESGLMKPAPLDSIGRSGGRADVSIFDNSNDYFVTDATGFKFDDCAEWLADV